MDKPSWNQAVKAGEFRVEKESENGTSEISAELIYIRERVEHLTELASKLRTKLIPVLRPRGVENETNTPTKEVEQVSPLGRALGEISEDLDDIFVFLTKLIDDLEL